MSNVAKAPDENPEHATSARIERRIVWNLIAYLERGGFRVVEVDDGGDENVSCADAKTAYDAIFAVDDATLFVAKGELGLHGIVLVGGNGEDVISDWSFFADDHDGFNAIMGAFKPEENW